jgi:hypothetical protein
MKMRKSLSTGSGMWGVWNYEFYRKIKNFDDWSSYFEEDSDIAAQIKNKKFVPINVNSDGIFEFAVKYAEKPDERESKYLLASSKPYIIENSGVLKVSGIEFIEADVRDDKCITIEIPKGTYSVIIHLIDWKAEPNALDEKGLPTDKALPDFIIEINSAGTNMEGNAALKTF